jgi:hypothetical protein
MLTMLMVRRGDLEGAKFEGFSNPSVAQRSALARFSEHPAWDMKPDRFLSVE